MEPGIRQGPGGIVTAAAQLGNSEVVAAAFYAARNREVGNRAALEAKRAA